MSQDGRRESESKPITELIRDFKSIRIAVVVAILGGGVAGFAYAAKSVHDIFKTEPPKTKSIAPTTTIKERFGDLELSPYFTCMQLELRHQHHCIVDVYLKYAAFDEHVQRIRKGIITIRPTPQRRR